MFYFEERQTILCNLRSFLDLDFMLFDLISSKTKSNYSDKSGWKDLNNCR